MPAETVRRGYFILKRIADTRVERETGFRGLWRRVKPADKPDEVHLSFLLGCVNVKHRVTGRAAGHQRSHVPTTPHDRPLPPL